MGEKDILEKTLESYNDVFADIVNGLLFNGEPTVREEDLEPAGEHSMYKADNKVHQQERDIAKYWKEKEIRIALYGLENQTSIDSKMPLRILGYDGTAYRNQLNQKVEKYYPVVTLVLYFGDKEWSAPRSLYECINVPEELKPFVNDYKINVFEICKLTDEQIGHFKSDFKSIAYFFAHKNEPKYISKGTTDKLKHTDEFFKLMSVLTNDNKYESVYNEIKAENKGGISMCDFLDKLHDESVAEGFAEGVATVIRTLAKTMTPEDIAEKLQKSVEEVKEVLSSDD